MNYRIFNLFYRYPLILFIFILWKTKIEHNHLFKYHRDVLKKSCYLLFIDLSWMILFFLSLPEIKNYIKMIAITKKGHIKNPDYLQEATKHKKGNHFYFNFEKTYNF